MLDMIYFSFTVLTTYELSLYDATIVASALLAGCNTLTPNISKSLQTAK